jgi:hypothetical protein
MKRSVEFRDNGDIVITGERSRDMIHEGVVLLTKEEAEQAVQWGWKIQGDALPDTQPLLYRVKR